MLAGGPVSRNGFPNILYDLGRGIKQKGKTYAKQPKPNQIHVNRGTRRLT